jgi:hypothetical protein
MKKKIKIDWLIDVKAEKLNSITSITVFFHRESGNFIIHRCITLDNVVSRHKSEFLMFIFQFDICKRFGF